MAPGRGPRRGPALASGAGHDHTTVGRPLLDSPSDYLLAGILLLVAIGAFGTWLTGQTAALITGGGWPRTDLADAFAVLVRLPRHLSDPAAAWPPAVRGQLPGPAGFAVAVTLDTVVMLTVATVVARWWGRGRRRRGFASAADIDAVFSPRAVREAGSRLRATTAVPTTTGEAQADDPAGSVVAQPRRTGRSGGRARPDLGEVSVDAGRTDPGVHGRSAPVRIGIENSVLVLAAPRQGKTSQVVIPWVTDWPGPVIVTSVRPDVVRATAALRPGTARVMDLTGARWENPLAWSPTTGCASFDTARRRADLLVTVGKTSSPGSSDATNSAFFGTSATNLLAGWLHAAALTGRTMRTVLAWALDDADHEPIELLRRHPDAAPGTAGMLDTLYRSPAETRSNLFTTVLTGIAPLLSETAQAAFSPTVPGFDPGEFLDHGDSVYLIVPESHARELGLGGSEPGHGHAGPVHGEREHLLCVHSQQRQRNDFQGGHHHGQ